MKRILLSFGIASLLTFALSSCASQRDCRGVKHTRLSNGITI